METIQYKQKNGNWVQAPVFNGEINKIMPKLVERGLNPISIAGIMEQRINAWQSRNKELEEKWNDYFDSGDGIIYHPDGRIKIVPQSQTIRKINSNNPLNLNGSLPLTNGTFNKTQGYEFSKAEVEKFANKYLTPNEIKENPIWLTLAQNDKKLLKEYVGQVYSKVDDTEELMMLKFLPSPKMETEKNLYIFDLDNNSIVGSFEYWEEIVWDCGRLVGIKPNVETKINLETLVGNFKTLEKMTTKYTKQELELIKQYEIKNDTKIGDIQYRKEEFQKIDNNKLTQAYNGTQNAIYKRINLDNIDIFNSLDDEWKLKILKENLGILEKLIEK